MTDLRQAATLALEALERYQVKRQDFDRFADEITALKAALEQPEQEPTAWEHHEYRPYGGPGETRIHAILRSQYMMPDGTVAGDFQWLADQYRADKNTIRLIPLYTTPPQQQAEPVAHYDFQECKFTWAKPMKIGPVPVSVAVDPMKLYSEAPQRQWLGLTDEEIEAVVEQVADGKLVGTVQEFRIRFSRAIEAKLKAKND